MRGISIAGLAATLCVIAACGLSPEEQAARASAQRADDQNRCYGYGFQPSTDAFAHCMMTTASQREAQQAADQRAAAIQQSISNRQNAAIKAQKDAADRDAWDRRTNQGIYSNSSWSPPSSSPPPFSTPVDAVRNSIQDDMNKMDRAGMLSQ